MGDASLGRGAFEFLLDKLNADEITAELYLGCLHPVARDIV
jgi:hypothetical protein